MNETSSEEMRAQQRTEVECLLRRRDLPPRVRERLEMVKAAALGQDLAAIAAWSGRTARTVQRWLQRYREGGAAAVADAPRAGRPPHADAATGRRWSGPWTRRRGPWGFHLTSGPRRA